jgi:restriction system protein
LPRDKPTWVNHTIRGKAASLRELDLTDISQPIAEVRRYLLAKYDARFNVHPRLFEETVASVFRDLGYDTQVTGYSGDGGIDVVLRGQADTIGVQVKRYRSTIKVEQIRSLAGALMLAGITAGVFVTTSSFQAGAPRTVARYRDRGMRIDLVNADAFFAALGFVQRGESLSDDERLRLLGLDPYCSDPDMQVIESRDADFF